MNFVNRMLGLCLFGSLVLALALSVLCACVFYGDGLLSYFAVVVVVGGFVMIDELLLVVKVYCCFLSSDLIQLAFLLLLLSLLLVCELSSLSSYSLSLSKFTNNVLLLFLLVLSFSALGSLNLNGY